MKRHILKDLILKSLRSMEQSKTILKNMAIQIIFKHVLYIYIYKTCLNIICIAIFFNIVLDC